MKCDTAYMARSVFLFLCVISVLTFSVAGRAHAAAGVPTILSYQGRLTDGSGNLVGTASGTTYYFKFSIWNVATGGTAGTDRLWPSSAPSSFGASVRQGVFTVNIGDTDNGFPNALDYDFNTNKDIFLQVEVSSNNSDFETLSPRQRISAAPFARLAGAVSGVGQSSFGTTTPATSAIVTINSTSSSSIPAFIRAAAGQVANLFRIENSSSSVLFSIDALGGISASSTLTIGTATSTSFVVSSGGNVGVGVASPSRRLSVFDVNSTPQLRLSQSSSAYGEFYVDSAGDVQFSSTGGNMRYNDENVWVCAGGSCGVDIPVEKGNIIVETSIIFNNRFRFKQTNASTTIMYDSADNGILEFDEGQ